MPIEITLPGSKSITNRILILSALSDKEVEIKNEALCDDTKYMITGLKKLGVKITQKGTTIKIKGNGGNFKKSTKPIKIFTGNAGTTTRFLTALATLTGNQVIIDGDKRMRSRPISELTKALNSIGALIESKNGYLPIKIFPQKLKGGKISLKGYISSQYISAILMVSPFAENPTTINIEQKLCSQPYISMTIKTINDFGHKVLNKKFRQFVIPNQKFLDNAVNDTLAEFSYTIEGDASSASYIGAYAALHQNKKILLKNIFKNSLQGDIKFLDYLEKLGCTTKQLKNGTEIQGPKFLNKTLGKIDMNATPDLVMTFAILAMLTKGKTKIFNIENLRIKETDRLKALETEIKKFDIKVKTGKDFIEIEGNPEKLFLANHENKKIKIETYNDHRIAMSFGILKSVLPNIIIKNPNCVSKSYPTFWKTLKELKKASK